MWFRFAAANAHLKQSLRDANGYFSDEAPWSLRKTIRENGENGGQAIDIEMEQQRLDIVVYISIECIRITSL